MANEAQLRHILAVVLGRAGTRPYPERDCHDAWLNRVILESKAPGAFQGRFASRALHEAFEQLR